jgi:hypothetical protein
MSFTKIGENMKRFAAIYALVVMGSTAFAETIPNGLVFASCVPIEVANMDINQSTSRTHIKCATPIVDGTDTIEFFSLPTIKPKNGYSDTKIVASNLLSIGNAAFIIDFIGNLKTPNLLVIFIESIL